MSRIALVTAVALLGCDSGGSSGESPRRTKAKAMLNSMEARRPLRQLLESATTYHLEHGKLPEPAPTTPTLGACCTEAARAVSAGLREEGRKCAADPALWATPPWQALDFAIEEPHRASYTLEIAGDKMIARAQIDIDCDGDFALFELRAALRDGEVAIEPDLYVERDSE